MPKPLAGIHHVTAIVEEPQDNLDFYTQVLGLRLVKQTVNFDDPLTYHLYYGDDLGRPGTVVTFFPWPDGRRGSRGAGQISALAFAVPAGGLAHWRGRLDGLGVRFGGPEDRLGAPTLSLYDPAGLLLELVERGADAREAAIRGLFGVTLTLADVAPTAAFLTERLGFRPAAEAAGRSRYLLGAGDEAAAIDLVARPDLPRGQVAAGSVHHVAWRVADEPALLDWQGELSGAASGVTPIRDRRYFQSVYFREPGGVLFEIATDLPGFAVDEAPEALGASLMLPPWLEPRRAEIESRLPPISPPAPAAPPAPPATQRAAAPHALSMAHVFIPAPNADAPTLLLLHGTGGGEHDLLDLGRAMAPQAALLSPRGQVLENGMARFFRRLAEGVFDLDDLRARTDELADFVAAAGAAYGIDTGRVIAVGYSNGANIAASLLLLRPGVLAGAALFHAMVPLVPATPPDLRGVPVFMGAGRGDPLIPPAETERLAQILRRAGADVALHWDQGGHALNPAERRAAANWLRANI